MTDYNEKKTKKEKNLSQSLSVPRREAVFLNQKWLTAFGRHKRDSKPSSTGVLGDQKFFFPSSGSNPWKVTAMPTASPPGKSQGFRWKPQRGMLGIPHLLGLVHYSASEGKASHISDREEQVCFRSEHNEQFCQLGSYSWSNYMGDFQQHRILV